MDVDECAEWGAVRLRGRLCGGECVNEPGSYRCACPAGYRLSDDGKSCIGELPYIEKLLCDKSQNELLKVGKKKERTQEAEAEA